MDKVVTGIMDTEGEVTEICDIFSMPNCDGILTCEMSHCDGQGSSVKGKVKEGWADSFDVTFVTDTLD